MRIVMIGATGFIGAALSDYLWNQYHSMVLLSRTPAQDVNVSKKEWISWNPGVGGEWERAIDGADGVINLAGEPIAGKRWSRGQKEVLRQSRIDSARSLVNAMFKAKS